MKPQHLGQSISNLCLGLKYSVWLFFLGAHFPILPATSILILGTWWQLP